MKTLILLRHGDRLGVSPHLDAGLTEKGKLQAVALARHFAKLHPGAKPLILSSPKLRCRETLAPLARVAGVAAEVSELLDERGPDEEYSRFEWRIRDFLQFWNHQAPELTVACSHGDWLPMAVEIETGGRIEIRKGSWAEIVSSSGKSYLRTLIQSFKTQGITVADFSG